MPFISESGDLDYDRAKLSKHYWAELCACDGGYQDDFVESVVKYIASLGKIITPDESEDDVYVELWDASEIGKKINAWTEADYKHAYEDRDWRRKQFGL